MNETAEKEFEPVLDALARLGIADSATVVLVGSRARGATHGRSDIDILVLQDDDRRIRLDRPGEVHLQQDSCSRFLMRLENGDDYPGWALRFGVPIRDPLGWWAKQVAAELNNPHWPDWRAKVDYARKRISVAREVARRWGCRRSIGRADVRGQSRCQSCSSETRTVSPVADGVASTTGDHRTGPCAASRPTHCR